MTKTITAADSGARTESAAAAQLAGKYLTFKLGREEYGVEILKVQEIIRKQEITRVPKTPEYVRGVINLRGKVIPVVELRAKFGMPSQEDTEKTCIIVIQFEAAGKAVITGVIIDEVKEVLDIQSGQIEDPPTFGGGDSSEFILGIGKIGDSVKLLLDIERVLNSAELASIGSGSAE
jgi:purine-binding chemotaxis protein CheW